MKKKTKLIFIIPGACLAILILLSIGYYFSGNYYRSHLPANPDFKMVPEAIRDQITEARSKAYYFPTATNIGELGKVFHSSAYYENAAACYKLAVEKSRKVRNNWIWNYYLGYLNLEMGEAKEAINNFSQVLEKNPGAYQSLFYIGEAWQNIGQKENAENIFKRVARLNNLVSLNQKTNREYYFPIQTYAEFRLARIYLSSNRLDSAETILKDIIAKQWTFGPAYRLLGEVYNKKGKPELGTKYVIRSSDLTDFTPPQDTLIDQIALISRSEKYILKQIDDAKMSCNFNWELRICNQALKYIPDNKYLLSNSILLFFTIGKDKDVLPLLPNHLKSYGNDYDEILKVADLLYEKGYRAEAFMYIEQAKKLQPESPGLALWFADHGELGKAITMINSLLQKKPDDEEVLTEAVRIYLNSGNKSKLMEYLNRFKKLYPSNLEAQKATALYYQSEGNEAAGLKIFQELAQKGIKDMNLYRYLSRYYLKNKFWDKAVLNFRQILQSFPNDPEALEGLGRLLISCPDEKLRNVAEGMENSERAFINFRTNTFIRVSASRNIATAAAMMGEKQKASWYINQTLAMAQKANFPPDEFVSYFEVLRRQYQLN